MGFYLATQKTHHQRAEGNGAKGCGKECCTDIQRRTVKQDAGYIRKQKWRDVQHLGETERGPAGFPRIGAGDGRTRIGSHTYGRSDVGRSEEHTSELQSRPHLVCRLLLEK